MNQQCLKRELLLFAMTEINLNEIKVQEEIQHNITYT